MSQYPDFAPRPIAYSYTQPVTRMAYDQAMAPMHHSDAYGYPAPPNPYGIPRTRQTVTRSVMYDEPPPPPPPIERTIVYEQPAPMPVPVSVPMQSVMMTPQAAPRTTIVLEHTRLKPKPKKHEPIIYEPMCFCC